MRTELKVLKIICHLQRRKERMIKEGTEETDTLMIEINMTGIMIDMETEEKDLVAYLAGVAESL